MIVVGDLAEIVDDDIALDDSVVNGAPVNTGVRPDLDAVADGDGAELRDLDPLAALVGVAEAVRADYRAGLEQAVRSDPDIVVNADARPELGEAPDGGMLSDKAVRADGDAVPNLGAVLNHCARAYGDALPEPRRRRDHGAV